MLRTDRTHNSPTPLHHRLAPLAVWASLLGAFQLYAWHTGLSPLGLLERISGWLALPWLGPLLYVVVYAVWPLALLPATAITLAAGYVYGPALGVAYTILGSTVSASVAYQVGRFFGAARIERLTGSDRIRRLTRHVHHNCFVTIMTMRLLFVPYDLVNYLAGMLRLRFASFIGGSVVGALPGTIALVLLGASLQGGRMSSGTFRIDPSLLAASSAMLVISFGLSWIVRRRSGEEVNG